MHFTLLSSPCLNPAPLPPPPTPPPPLLPPWVSTASTNARLMKMPQAWQMPHSIDTRQKMNAPHALQQAPGWMARAPFHLPAHVCSAWVAAPGRAPAFARRTRLRERDKPMPWRQKNASTPTAGVTFNRAHLLQHQSSKRSTHVRLHSRSLLMLSLSRARARALSLSLPPFSHFLIVNKTSLSHTHTHSLSHTHTHVCRSCQKARVL